ncbi:nitrate/nitrite response regulator [Erythrobacter sp. NAP1]|uniref:LuxR C-terminal-related transcriptional regulator n=1 Tax=Erythrobacter sp. NAP1 TaxID=237727 RepID=UPI00006851F0|nr:response regulator transcription factor [Erythrobacter sp. NAP1]EAQ27688.1 nitrate/nitrite response regulator [Erythrobacter sp. NAP1]
MAVALALRNALYRTALSDSLSRLGHTVADVAPSVDRLELCPFNEENEPLVVLTEAPSTLRPLARALKPLRDEAGQLRCVMLEEKFDLFRLADCFSIGCHGFLLTSIPIKALSCALNFVASGHRVYPDNLGEALNGWRRDNLEHTRSNPKLTDRERHVGTEVAQGHPNKVIARDLNLSEASVKLSIQALQRKLGVRNRTQVAVALVVRGLVPTPCVRDL